MKLIDKLYVALVIIGMVFTFFAFQQYKKSKNLIATGIYTEATVVDLIRSRGKRSDSYTPVFEYKDKYGHTVRFKASYSTNSPGYYIGEVVPIVYSEDNKHKKVVSYWGLYRDTIMFSIIGSVFLIIGGGYLIYLRKRSRKVSVF